MITAARATLVVTLLAAFASAGARCAEDCVVLLHGLARTAKAMQPMAEYLEKQGYRVATTDYPSREAPIEELAPDAVERGLKACRPAKRIHFVTHSMGGILVRFYLQDHTIPELGHVVMLAPPNQGSEVVDRFGAVPGFGLLNGPAGKQLGTDENSVPRALQAVNFSVGVIAGNKTFNPLLSQALPNPDDGKVSVEAARVEGMRDFLVVPHSHPFIMRATEVMRQTVFFLRSGRFDRGDEAQSPDERR